jgi:hypothetical protein
MCYMQNYPWLILKTLRFALLATCLVCLAAMALLLFRNLNNRLRHLRTTNLQFALRVTTRLVQVNVVVNDKNGRSILGLDKDSFTLLDAPTKQPATPLSCRHLYQPR